MSKYVFLYKENNEDEDRDCIKYIEPKPMRFECNHYFGGVNLSGACFSGGEWANYENIQTVLTQNEYQQLINFNKDIQELGMGITKGDERYQKGVKLCEDIQPIYDKLLSDENQKLFETIQQEEREFLNNEYNLSDEDIDYIFDNYGLDYRDRAVISVVFDDIESAAEEEADQLGYVTKENERYFDYEKFGQDLLEGEQYLELDDGRIVYLNY